MEVSGRKLQADASIVDMTYCQPCSKDGENVPPESYCIVCEEFMCSNCTRLHKNQKISSSHALLGKGSMPTSMPLQSMKQDSTEPCEIHSQEVIKYFCPTHKTLICGHCLATDHRSCHVDIISEITDTFKDREYGHIKNTIAELLNNTNICQSNIERSILFVTKLGEEEIAKVRKYRIQINEYFEQREKYLLKTIQNMKEIDETLLDSLNPKCESLKSKVLEVKSKLEAQENNTIQLFIEAKRAQKIMDGMQTALADIIKENAVNKYQFRKDPSTERLMTTNNGLGTIEEKGSVEKQTLVAKRGNLERRTQFPGPITIDVSENKCIFINTSQTAQAALGAEMKKCFATFNLCEDKRSVELACTLTSDIENYAALTFNWKGRAVQTLQHFMDNISEQDITVKKDLWKTVKLKLSKLYVDQPDNCAIYLSKRKLNIKVVGMKHVADQLVSKIEAMIMDVTFLESWQKDCSY
ncbi:E3 ubiquitin-protein ligase TRIM71-like [Mya arenaria]|uniref:E3 ubiquitin-protein ligase TRIM71-like n=1 Tax=Mya arenaria TaxID=6604 RepID=UPI0022E54C0D|nr:E3 ubiquitin-protein ligase TRIM71-like [Mya arenaria]XP_052770552.1 E3 ubiquitin-protein ligase TRIM71-like [Mya arenaria]XP_052770553.1 E3 ubiquitin-protein ligase TRIM71-like [Mya arenaria]